MSAPFILIPPRIVISSTFTITIGLPQTWKAANAIGDEDVWRSGLTLSPCLHQRDGTWQKFEQCPKCKCGKSKKPFLETQVSSRDKFGPASSPDGFDRYTFDLCRCFCSSSRLHLRDVSGVSELAVVMTIGEHEIVSNIFATAAKESRSRSSRAAREAAAAHSPVTETPSPIPAGPSSNPLLQFLNANLGGHRQTRAIKAEPKPFKTDPSPAQPAASPSCVSCTPEAPAAAATVEIPAEGIQFDEAFPAAFDNSPFAESPFGVPSWLEVDTGTNNGFCDESAEICTPQPAPQQPQQEQPQPAASTSEASVVCMITSSLGADELSALEFAMQQLLSERVSGYISCSFQATITGIITLTTCCTKSEECLAAHALAVFYLTNQLPEMPNAIGRDFFDPSVTALHSVKQSWA